MTKITTTLLFLLIFGVSSAQVEKRVCGAMDHHHHLENTVPNYATKRSQIENFTQNYISNPVAKKRTVVTIPVVVHVVYNTGSQNISDAQIQSQIAILNQDYRRLNADFTNTPGPFQGVSADCEVQFVLARRDPNGDSTTGITRTSTIVTSFTYNDNVKRSANGGKDPWPSSQYLNIWTCKLSNGLLGYAQFPGGPELTDGVVCSFRAFGNTGAALAPFNKGRTATHEVGHWLNLFHIWGDDGTSCNGTDLVGDTPNQAGENYGCPTYPKISCNNTPTGDMFMNFMDYTDDACMSMFTAGQKARMDAMFVSGGPRESLLSSLGGVYPTPVITCGIPTNVNATNITSSGALLSWDVVGNAVSYTLQVREAGTQNWTSYTPSINSFDLTNLSSFTNYEVQIQSNCSAGSSQFSPIFTFTTAVAAPQTCGTPISLNTSNVSHNSVTIDWQAVQDATTYTISYRELGMPTWSTQNSNSAMTSLENLIPQTPYEFYVTATCPYGVSQASNLGYFSTLVSPAPTCTNSFEPNDELNQAASIEKNTIYASIIESETDIDYFTFTTTTQQPKFKVSLTNVPADYDLKVYNNNGILVLSSQNGRIQPENCISNNTSQPGQFFIKVNGYNGKYDPVNCYRLLLETSSNDFKIETAESLDSETKPSVYYHPNPANTAFKVDLYAKGNQDVFYQLVNLLGQSMHSGILTTTTGLNVLEINTAHLPNGMYLLQIQKQDEHFVERIQIQH
jgi:hypothetical protein